MSNWLNYLGSQALKKGNTESHLLFLPSLLLHQITNFPPLRSPSASEAEGDISDFDFTFTDRKKKPFQPLDGPFIVPISYMKLRKEEPYLNIFIFKQDC